MKKHTFEEKLEEESKDVALGALSRTIARFTEDEELHTTPIVGLSLFRRDEPTDPISSVYEPSICVVTQGAKRVLLGDDTYVYDAKNYLITSVHLPTIVQIIEASRAKPCLGLRLKFDLREVSQLMADSNLPAPRAQKSSRGMATGNWQRYNATAQCVHALGRPAR